MHGLIHRSEAGLGVALVFLFLAFAPAALAAYQLVFEDEFDGQELNLAKWQPQIGDGCPSLCGWGNNELQYYRAENATVSDGLLTITAKEESFGGRSYTSARLRTRDLGDWLYGRFEMRAKMPIGRGIWPAFWMLPTDNVYGTWPASGEIDILEYLGHRPEEVFGTIHYGGPTPIFASTKYTLPSGTFHDEFHTFAMEWDPFEIRWYVDGAQYACNSHWSSSGGTYPAPFDQRFHLLLNMAVGGNLPGPPDGTTVFPQEYVIDWVRVWQSSSAPSCCILFDGMDHARPDASNDWFTFAGVGGGGIGGNTTDLPPENGCRASLEVGFGGPPGFIGGFGRRFPLNVSDMTHFSFWINPDAGQSYTLEINLQDDDNGDEFIPITPDGADDEFQYNVAVSPVGPGAVAGGGWQRISIPLASFFDDNSFHFGGNGIFDPVPSSEGGNGPLVNVVITITSTAGGSQTFRTDHWIFEDHSFVSTPEIGSKKEPEVLLAPNVPNPFGPGTQIRFELPQSGRFRLTVHDLGGRLVRALAEGSRHAGVYTVDWNGRDHAGGAVASGVYFLRLESGIWSETRKIVVER